MASAHEALLDGFEPSERYVYYFTCTIVFFIKHCQLISSLSAHNKAIKANLMKNVVSDKYDENQVKCKLQ